MFVSTSAVIVGKELRLVLSGDSEARLMIVREFLGVAVASVNRLSRIAPMRVAMIIGWIWSLTLLGQCQEAPQNATIKEFLDEVRASEEPKMTYEELKSNSDLVLIATVIGKRPVERDYVDAMDFDEDSVQRTAIQLKVHSVLKGAAKDEIEIVTTEWFSKTMRAGVRTNFASLEQRLLLPNLCATEIDDEIVDWRMIEGEEKVYVVPEYLLYLKRTNRENTYTPVTGQRWGGVSVRDLR